MILEPDRALALVGELDRALTLVGELHRSLALVIEVGWPDVLACRMLLRFSPFFLALFVAAPLIHGF